MKYPPLFFAVLSVLIFVFVAPVAGAAYREELEALAVWCEEHGLPEEARTTRAAIWPDSPDRLHIPVFPREVGTLATIDPGKSVATPREEWTLRFSTLRKARAKSLFEEANRLAAVGKGHAAIDRALECLQADPDHLAARTLFGFREHEGFWRTAWEIEQARRGTIDHPRFGWVPSEYVTRYEKGERYWIGPGERKGRWISAAEEQKRRADIRSGWVLVSEHYELRTNVGLEEGVNMLRDLEDLYTTWVLLFFQHFRTDAQLAKLFTDLEPGKPVPAAPVRLSVYVYANKEDYARNLREIEPDIAVTTGFYYPPTRRCYFYPPNDSMDAIDRRHMERTPYHEGTHQLFQECLRLKDIPSRTPNFWIFEGIAMYMETLRREGDFYVLGGESDGTFINDRLDAARIRYRQGFYVPFNTLAGMDKGMFQAFRGYPRPREGTEGLQRLYSQSAGCAQFLLHAENGRFRSATIAYLYQFYKGTSKRNTLTQLCGLDFTELDRLYDRSMREDDRSQSSGQSRNTGR